MALRIRRDRRRHRHRPGRRPPPQRPHRRRPPAAACGPALAAAPLLTPRSHGARQPLRVIFDSQARLPLDSQLLQTLDQAPVLVVTAADAPNDRLTSLQAAGAETLVAGGIEAALTELGRRNITSLFLEGGKTLATSFLAADQIDESRPFVAPVLLGGSEKGGTTADRLVALESSVEPIGDDMLITARFKEW